MDDKVDKLEKNLIRVEMSICNLAEKVSDTLDVLASIKTAVQGFVVLNTKMERLDSDMSKYATTTREDIRDLYKLIDTLKSDINDLSVEHTNTNTEALGKLDDKCEKRSTSRTRIVLTVFMTALAFVFGYFYLDLKSGLHPIVAINKIVHNNQLLLKEHTGRMNVFNTKLETLAGEHP